MSGVPGSGKSSYISYLRKEWEDDKFFICSTNHYFQRDLNGRFDPDADFLFDEAKLPQAHAICLKKFVEEIIPGSNSSVWADIVVVDNTNLTSLELSPYVCLGLAYGIPVEIITIMCDPRLAKDRNVHGFSLQSISKMDSILRKRTLPTHWNISVQTLNSVDL